MCFICGVILVGYMVASVKRKHEFCIECERKIPEHRGMRASTCDPVCEKIVRSNSMKEARKRRRWKSGPSSGMQLIELSPMDIFLSPGRQ